MKEKGVKKSSSIFEYFIFSLLICLLLAEEKEKELKEALYGVQSCKLPTPTNGLSNIQHRVTPNEDDEGNRRTRPTKHRPIIAALKKNQHPQNHLQVDTNASSVNITNKITPNEDIGIAQRFVFPTPTKNINCLHPASRLQVNNNTSSQMQKFSTPTKNRRPTITAANNNNCVRPASQFNPNTSSRRKNFPVPTNNHRRTIAAANNNPLHQASRLQVNTNTSSTTQKFPTPTKNRRSTISASNNNRVHPASGLQSAVNTRPSSSAAPSNDRQPMIATRRNLSTSLHPREQFKMYTGISFHSEGAEMFESPTVTTVPTKKKIWLMMPLANFPIMAKIRGSTKDDDALLEEVLDYFGNERVASKTFDCSKKAMRPMEKTATRIDVHRGRTVVHFHQVVKSHDYDRLKTNATKTKWLTQVLDSVGASSTEETVGWTITYLGNHFPDELSWAIGELKLPTFKKRMDVYASVAMWHDDNIPILAQRKICSHMYCWFGFWMTESEQKLQSITEYFIRPVHGNAVTGLCWIAARAAKQSKI